MNIPKPVNTIALVLAGAGALNIALTKFVSFNMFSVLPTGIVSTLAYALVGASGALVIYNLFSNKI